MLAGYATYLLVRHLTGMRAAAFVAGLIFAFCPYHFAHLLGQLNLVSLQWIPFYVLALLHAWDWPPAATPGAGASLGPVAPRAAIRALGGDRGRLAGAHGLYRMDLRLISRPLYPLVCRLAARPTAPAEIPWPAFLRRAGVLAGVWLLLVGPVLVPMVQEALTTQLAQTSLQLGDFLSADATNLLVPSLFHPLWRVVGPVLEPHYAGRPRSRTPRCLPGIRSWP